MELVPSAPDRLMENVERASELAHQPLLQPPSAVEEAEVAWGVQDGPR